MPLSQAEKALAESAYARISSGRKYFTGISGGIFGGIMGVMPTTVRHLFDPHISHGWIIFYSSLIGLFLGVSLTLTIMGARQRKRDEELVRFFENRFPADCSWKQEEKILAQAEDIRLKAKVANAIHGHAAS